MNKVKFKHHDRWRECLTRAYNTNPDPRQRRFVVRESIEILGFRKLKTVHIQQKKSLSLLLQNKFRIGLKCY